MPSFKRHRWFRLIAAFLFAGLVAGGAQAYEARFASCSVGEDVCGESCAMAAFDCDWCSVPPNQCVIEFGDCSSFWCDTACPDPCVIGG